ncbi:MAG: hypothetical protein CVV14_03885 [Gammaproteobacteria bacterium HGW-Gammaproteobacteria-4]|jgi:hypothetical protein|nr:MAG: hypothetical protein CVV14_03885 [Gammaproteobacteria bacterium HGW-Gammaproteobacteria-4]
MMLLARPQWPLLGVVLLLAALWWLRAPLADHLLPRSATERLLVQAEQALQQGRLSADDGSGASERFAAVLARDPDRAAARAGLERVARAALLRAEQRLADDEPVAALALLDIARAAGAPSTEVDALLLRVRAGRSSETVLRALLDSARQAQALGNLDGGSDSALARFNEVLERDPGNVLALDGRDGVLASMLAQAHKRLDVGDDAGALAMIERVDAIAPRHLGLPAARAALASHLGGAPAQATLRRAAITAAIQQGQLDAALTLLAAVPDMQADDAVLRRELASAWARRAIVEAARDHGRARRAARDHLAVLSAAAGDAAGFMALVEARGDAWRMRRDGTSGEAGWSALFSAMKADAASAALDRQRADMRQCFEQALASIWLTRAATCLEAMSALVSRADAAEPDRARLARVYLGVAEERLGRGDIEEARRAVHAAQLWNPGDAGLSGLFARLGQL